MTKKDSYPLPHIDETIEKLAGCKWFSTLDLPSGYWQVQMDPKDTEKTAFSTGTGLWQFKVMPFGLCNAPATFERLMERVLQGLPTQVCLIYLDDILVTGTSFADHMTNLKQVFEKFREVNLELSPEKSLLCQSQVGYLGHIVGSEGISTDCVKTEVVKEWPKPTSKKEIKRFLGFCSYYRKFVPKFADIAHPLHSLVNKAEQGTATLKWTAEAD